MKKSQNTTGPLICGFAPQHWQDEKLRSLRTELPSVAKFFRVVSSQFALGFKKCLWQDDKPFGSARGARDGTRGPGTEIRFARFVSRKLRTYEIWNLSKTKRNLVATVWQPVANDLQWQHPGCSGGAGAAPCCSSASGSGRVARTQKKNTKKKQKQISQISEIFKWKKKSERLMFFEARLGSAPRCTLRIETVPWRDQETIRETIRNLQITDLGPS